MLQNNHTAQEQENNKKDKGLQNNHKDQAKVLEQSQSNQTFSSGNQVHEDTSPNTNQPFSETLNHLKEGTTFDDFIMENDYKHKSTASSVIRFARHQYLDVPIALKFFSTKTEYEHELQIYNQGLSYDFIPKLYKPIDPTDSMPGCIAMERAQYSLGDWMGQGQHSAPDKKAVLYQIIAAVQYLHDRNLVHRDLKPANIMKFIEKGRESWKLVNFGSWGRVGKEAELQYTLRYAAPEVVVAAEAGQKRVVEASEDMWSFGVIALDILSGKRMYGANASDQDVKDMLLGRQPLPLEGSASVLNAVQERTAKRVLKNLLLKNPQGRWTSSRVYDHALFKPMESTTMKEEQHGRQESLLNKLQEGVEGVDKKADKIEQGVQGIDKKADKLEEGVQSIDKKVDRVLELQEVSLADLKTGALMLCIDFKEILQQQGGLGKFLRTEEVVKTHYTGIDDPAYELKLDCSYTIHVSLHHQEGKAVPASKVNWVSITAPDMEEEKQLEPMDGTEASFSSQWKYSAKFSPADWSDPIFKNIRERVYWKENDPTDHMLVTLNISVEIAPGSEPKMLREVQVTKKIRFRMNKKDKQFLGVRTYKRAKELREYAPAWAKVSGNCVVFAIQNFPSK